MIYGVIPCGATHIIRTIMCFVIKTSTSIALVGTHIHHHMGIKKPL